MKKILIALTISLIGFSTFAQNAEKTISQKIAKDYPNLKVSKIVYVPDVKLYELTTKVGDKSIFFFTNDKLDFLINVNSGEVLSPSSKKNITTSRQFDRNIETFKSLPFETAFSIKYGDGSRKIAVFSDPDCPFCQEMEKNWDMQPPNNVTVYYFMNPLKSIHPNADEISKRIVCSAEPAKNWIKYTTAPTKEDAFRALPKNPSNCEKAKFVDQQDELAAFLGFNGTPYILFDNGIITSGKLSSDDVNKGLKQRDIKK